MFKSKTIGWITALTLLCVAGVALACRLKEGSGAAAQAVTVAQADDKKPEAPPPLPEATPPPAEVPSTPQINENNIDVTPIKELTTPPVTVEPIPSPPVDERAIAEPTAPPPAPLVAAPTPPAEMPVTPPTESTTPSKPEAPVAIEPEAKYKTEETVPSVPAPGFTTAIPKTETKPTLPARIDTPPPKVEVIIPAPEVKVISEPKSVEAKMYTAKSGETLRDIAKKTLGSADRWKELDHLNPDLRAGTIVPSGTVIRLPGDASAPPVGGQVESEAMSPSKLSKLKALPIVRMRKPDSSKVRSPMIGSFECKMDDKLGLFIPNNVFEQFDKSAHLLLTPGPDQCLWLVTQTGAARVVERVEKAHLDNSDVEGFRRLFYSQSARCKVELKTGRVEIPEKLAEYAGLSGEVVLVGVEDHFELWDSARWQKYSQQKASMSKSE